MPDFNPMMPAGFGGGMPSSLSPQGGGLGLWNFLNGAGMPHMPHLGAAGGNLGDGLPWATPGSSPASPNPAQGFAGLGGGGGAQQGLLALWNLLNGQGGGFSMGSKSGSPMPAGGGQPEGLAGFGMPGGIGSNGTAYR